MREGVGRGRASAPSFLVVGFPLLQSGTTCASALHSMPFSFYAEGHVRPPGCHPVFFKCLQLSPAPFPVHGKRMPVPFGRSGYVYYSSQAVLYGRISLPFCVFCSHSGTFIRIWNFFFHESSHIFAKRAFVSLIA